jgi:hypothetical protein
MLNLLFIPFFVLDYELHEVLFMRVFPVFSTFNCLINVYKSLTTHYLPSSAFPVPSI